MKLFCCLLLVISSAIHSRAQQVNNVRAEPKGDIIYVFYDLKGSMENQKYKISLFSSHNDQAEPLALVSGNVGDTIVAGADKKIEWQAKNEISRYNGEIIFEVQATLVFSPIILTAPQAAKVYKRAKDHTFAWKGGVANEKIRLELFDGNTRVAQTEDILNKKNYNWKIPAGIKPGDDYRLKVTTVNYPENYSLSKNFSIRRKYSWPVKLIPFAAVVAGAAIYHFTRPPDLRLPGPPALPPE